MFALILFISIAVFGQVSGSSELSIIDPGSNTSPTRIVGGAPTTIQRYPYAVQLVIFRSQFLCGGSLITRRHVLTAAHCFILENYLVRPVDLQVRAGATNLMTGGQTRDVSTIVMHPSYNNPIRDNDIAILVLSSQVSLGSGVQTAAIPGQGWVLPDSNAVVHVGWGVLWEGSQTPSSVLQEVVVYSVNREICRQRYYALTNISNLITSNMLCAGVLDIGGRDACQGDSGGPLIYRTVAGDIVVGVTSFGEGCARPQYPGVSARVSSYTSWVLNTVNRYGGNAANHPLNISLLISSIFAMILAKY